MLNTSTNNINKTPSLFSLPKPFVAGNEPNFVQLHNSSRAYKASIGALFSRKLHGDDALTRARRRSRNGGLRVEAVATTDSEQTLKVKAIISVKPTVGGLLSNVGISRGLDDLTDLLGKSLLLEIVSAEAQPSK